MNKSISLLFVSLLLSTSFCQVKLAPEDVGSILSGLLYGALEVETPDILLCGYDVT